MSSPDAWQQYLDALHTVARAPVAGADRRRTIDEQLAATRGQADEDEAHVATRQQRLEEQVRQLRAAIDQALRDDEIAPDGPVAAVGLPAPTTIAEARGTLTRLERQLAADQRDLAAARRTAERDRLRRQRQLRTILVAGAIGLLILVVMAVVVMGGR